VWDGVAEVLAVQEREENCNGKYFQIVWKRGTGAELFRLEALLK
jgi:hypothetical protein